MISVIQILIVYFGGELFRSVPLSASGLLIAIGMASLVLVFDGVRRVITRLT